jgi:GntR family transcriptional regulator/MocR family aminotransferase
LPAVDAFPFKLWKKLWLESWRELTAEQLGYGAALGYWPLREAIATYLQAARGLRCTAEQVIITNGAQQALSLSALLLLNKGDQAWVENPSFNGIKAVLRSASARIVPISVDEDGLVVGEALARAPRARLVFISPSHQFPLGVTMSLTRRLKLLQWAQESDAWILEDDYDSEFRYAAYPLTALQGLDTRGRVIYIGTFSKVLFPALRIGYMVVPSGLIEAFRAARAHADRGSTLLEQLVLARFVAEGHLARHIRRMRSLYAKRQAVFVEAVQTHLQGWLDVQPNDTGLHLVAWLPEGLTINTFHESYWKTVSTSLRFHHMR